MTSDQGFRKGLEPHLLGLSLDIKLFPCVSSFLRSARHEEAACAIVDLDSEEVDEQEMQQILAAAPIQPLIFVGTGIDVRATVRALKAGAYDFFPRCFEVSTMMASVRAAVTYDRRLRFKRRERQDLNNRYQLLTPREREVLPLVVGGLLNKQAASVLGISEITLQIHRGQVMRKMRATSVAELVRMAMTLKLPYWRPAAETACDVHGFRDAPHQLSKGRFLAQSLYA